MKKLVIGSLSLLGIAFVILIIAGIGLSAAGQSSRQTGFTPPRAPVIDEASPAAKVGETIVKGGWQVRVHATGPYEQYVSRPPSPLPQGKLVVIEFAARNLDQKTSNFTINDFQLIAPDGRQFAPAGQTGSIERGFVITQTVQPGLVTQNRVVFDLDPQFDEYTLTILGTKFRIPVTD